MNAIAIHKRSMYVCVYIYICYLIRVLGRVPCRRKKKAHSQEPQTGRVAMSRRDRHALISEVIRGLEDSGFTSLKALQEMLERRLGISLSDRKREIRQYTEIVTDIAAGEPRSTAASEVHGDIALQEVRHALGELRLRPPSTQ